jgi:hypothetical protein
MKIYQEMKPGVGLCGLILLSCFILAGCSSSLEDEYELLLPSTELTPASATNSLSLTDTQIPTALVSPDGTKTPSPIPSLTNTQTSPPIVSLITTPFPDGYVLFEADFETDSENLTMDAGWQIIEDENGNHSLCNFDQSIPSLQINVGETNWENYQLEFDVKQTEFVEVSEMLLVHVRENDLAYYAFLVYFTHIENYSAVPAGSGYVSFGKSPVSGEYIPLPGEYFSEPYENQWYRVRIEAYEGDISFYWNDELVVNYHDEDYLPTGAISIRTDDGTCLDNIRVTNIQNPSIILVDAQKLLDDLLMNNAGCNLPCFWGITPGITTWEEAKSFLETFAHFTGARVVNGEILLGYFHIPFPGDMGTVTHTYVIEEGIVTGIKAYNGDLAPAFYLPEILKTYGQPDGVYIRTFREEEQNSQPFLLDLFYPDLGILMEFSGGRLIDDSGDHLTICLAEMNSPFIYLWSPEQEMTFQQATEMYLDTENLPQPIPLQEAAGMNIYTFYKYLVELGTVCIETPKAMWPFFH